MFISQSLLKERRRLPTGGLSEALEESLRRGVSTPPSPIVGSKTTPGASEVGFSSSRGKGLVTALRGIAPIGAFPVGASLLVGATKGFLIQVLSNFLISALCCFLRIGTFLDLRFYLLDS